MGDFSTIIILKTVIKNYYFILHILIQTKTAKVNSSSNDKLRFYTNKCQL